MSSVERFNRTLKNRYEVFRKRLDETVSSFAKSDSATRARQASALADAGRDLMDILVDSDQPPWIAPISESARAFAQRSSAENGHGFLRTAVKRYHKVAPIVIADETSTHDFDQLFERLRNERRIPELFDEMIDVLSKMIDSSEIDSVTVVSALQRLLNVLKANRSGSYVAVSQSVFYASFVQNLTITFLKRIPVIGELVEAFEKTVREAEEADADLRKQLQDETVNMILDQKMVAKLKQLSEKQSLLLEAPQQEVELDAEVDM